MNDNNYSFGLNQYYPNQGNYDYGTGNGGVLNKIGNGISGIYNYRWLLIFIMLMLLRMFLQINLYYYFF